MAAKLREEEEREELHESRQPLLSTVVPASASAEPPAGGASSTACAAPASTGPPQQQQQQPQQLESSGSTRVEAWTQDVERPAPALAVPVAGAAATWHGMPMSYGAPLPQPPPQYPQSSAAAAAAAERAAANAFLAASMGFWHPHAEWEKLRPTLAAWMVCSIINFVLLTRAAFNGFLLAVIASVIGFTTSLRVALPSCREGMDELSLAKQVHVCAGMATALDLITLFITEMALLVLALAPCPAGPLPGGGLPPSAEECSALRVAAATAAFFFALVLGVHGALSARVARRAHVLVQLLNPITTGRLSL